jgi:hypothetical protein
VAAVIIGVGHRRVSAWRRPIACPCDPTPAPRRVRPRTVLAPAMAGAPRLAPGAESERFRQHLEKVLADPAQAHQHVGDPRRSPNAGSVASQPEKRSGSRPLSRCSGAVHRLHAPAHPAQRAGQLDVRAQTRTGRFPTRRLLHAAHHGLHLAQPPRQPRGKPVRQQAEGAPPLGAVPTCDQGAGRGDARIGAVAGKAAAAAADAADSAADLPQPTLFANILLAGVLTCEAKLHRPWARTAPTVAGLLLSEQQIC